MFTIEKWFNTPGWLFSVITTTGNGFLVLFIVKKRRLHSTANWLVLSLVVADFGMGVAIFPMGHLCSILVICNESVCVTLHWFFFHSSVTNLGILTCDRYINIVHSFRYPDNMTSRSPGIVIFMSWVIPLIISLAIVVGMHATISYTVWKISRITGVSIFDKSACVLSHRPKQTEIPPSER